MFKKAFAKYFNSIATAVSFAADLFSIITFCNISAAAAPHIVNKGV